MGALEPVTPHGRRVLVVASGPSAEGMDLCLAAEARRAGVYVLAVNGAGLWVPAADGWFTLDPDERALRVLALRPGTYDNFVAVPDDYGASDARVRYHRDRVLPAFVHRLRRVSGDGPLSCRYGLSEDRAAVHTGNSAYGALGVAYHMRPDRVGLIGVDARAALGYAYAKGRPRTRLDHVPRLFASAAPQLAARGIDVMNGSPGSAVACFRAAPPDDVLRWLMG